MSSNLVINQDTTSVKDAVQNAQLNLGQLIDECDGPHPDQKQLLKNAMDAGRARHCNYCGIDGHLPAHCWLYGQLYYECKIAGQASQVAFAQYKVYK